MRVRVARSGRGDAMRDDLPALLSLDEVAIARVDIAIGEGVIARNRLRDRDTAILLSIDRPVGEIHAVTIA